MRKTVFAAGLAAGYVLGARAGRERYETIARAARRVQSSQTVQSAAGVLWARASTVGASAAEAARGRVPFADKLPFGPHRNGVRTLVEYHSGRSRQDR
jgi:hypothetical protein